jgi:ABC-type polysaccharide/polyol phosphate transport system ATPase subunit
MSERALNAATRAGETPRVEFEHVWKKFRRGQVHDSLRDLIPAIGKRLMGRGPRGDELNGEQDFWALRDVNFTVEPGQALGVIGANGAGKSTVLKTLTKILRPTRGRCEVYGRVGALIEIAAGFHQDLSGRENVYLQGAIMGMRRAEIARKFDEIVEFAGVADFIDTPVKRYSSGMNARLGFSIAAHLDPEVLIIDEVLAVGDIKFQSRAFERIQSMVRSGIPVIVVSHQLDRIVSLCTHGLLLKRGVVARQGTPTEVVAAFVSEDSTAPVEHGDEPILVDGISVRGGDGVRSGERCTVRIVGTVKPEAPEAEHASLGMRLRAAHNGEEVYWVSSSQCHVELPAAGPFELDIDIQMNLPPGVYTAETLIWSTMTDRQLAAGPMATIQVLEGTHFWGVAQLNPRFTVRGDRAGTGAAPAADSAAAVRAAR